MRYCLPLRQMWSCVLYSAKFNFSFENVKKIVSWKLKMEIHFTKSIQLELKMLLKTSFTCICRKLQFDILFIVFTKIPLFSNQHCIINIVVFLILLLLAEQWCLYCYETILQLHVPLGPINQWVINIDH